jgi:hypothetical protein
VTTATTAAAAAITTTTKTATAAAETNIAAIGGGGGGGGGGDDGNVGYVEGDSDVNGDGVEQHRSRNSRNRRTPIEIITEEQNRYVVQRHVTSFRVAPERVHKSHFGSLCNVTPQDGVPPPFVERSAQHASILSQRGGVGSRECSRHVHLCTLRTQISQSICKITHYSVNNNNNNHIMINIQLYTLQGIVDGACDGRRFVKPGDGRARVGPRW